MQITTTPKGFSKAAQKLIEEQTKIDMRVFQPKVIRLLKREIQEHIARGVSPVARYGKYKAYSKSYKKQINAGRYPGKSIRPINLWLTGKMMKSLKGKPSRDGFTIWFSDGTADFHNNLGAGKSRVIRKMLPDDDETFNQTITRKVDKLFKDTF